MLVLPSVANLLLKLIRLALLWRFFILLQNYFLFGRKPQSYFKFCLGPEKVLLGTYFKNLGMIVFSSKK
jgi:hypothetical protein